MYDTTDKDSFKKIPQILKKIYDYAKPDSSIIMVGTKSDLVHKRQVTFEEAKNYADSKEFNL